MLLWPSSEIAGRKRAKTSVIEPSSMSFVPLATQAAALMMAMPYIVGDVTNKIVQR